MKKKFTAFLLVLCLTVSLFLTGCRNKSLSIEEVQNNPISYLKAGSEIISEAWGFSSSKFTVLMGNLAKQGQIELNLDMTDYKLKNVLAFDDKAISNELTGSIESQKIDLMAYLDGEDIMLRSSTLLGSDDTYGLKLNNFFAQGTESNLAKVFGLTEETLDVLEDLLVGEKETNTGWLESWIQEKEALEEDYWALFEKTDIAVAEEKTIIDGAEVDAITITIPQTTELMQSVVDFVFGMFEGVKDVEESVVEAKAEIKAMEAEGSYIYYLNKETGALMQCNVDLTINDGTADMVEKATITYGVDPAISGKMDMDITVEVDGETTTIVGGITKATDEKSERTKLDLTMSVAGEEIKLAIDLNYDTESKEYTLTFEWDDGYNAYALKLNGVCTIEKDKAEISILSVKMDDVTVDLNLSLKISTEVTMPEKPEYQDLLTLEDARLTELVTNLSLNMVPLISSGYSDYYDHDSENECTYCYNEATKEVEYLGGVLGVCDTCAAELETIKNGSYCDSCWTENTNLTVENIYGIDYRLCPDCYEIMSSY